MAAAVALGLVVTLGANAQTGTGMNFSASTDAVAVHYKGNWYAGSIIDENLDIIDSKSDANGNVNSFYLVGEEQILAPTAGYTYYGGGFKYVPTKSVASLLGHTNLPVDSLRVYVKGTVGNVIPVKGATYLTGNFSVGTSYAVTKSGSVVWTPIVAGWQNPGTYYVSTGLQAFWGGAGNVNSQSPKSALLRRLSVKR